MSGSNRTAQRRFWDAILCLARLQRSRKNTDYQTARAALEVEEMATERLRLLQDEGPAEPAAEPIGAGQVGETTQAP